MISSLVVFALAAVLLATLVIMSRIEKDKGWKKRWHKLSRADRTRIGAAARSGALLADPEEAELAAKLPRYERTDRAVRDLQGIILLATGALVLINESFFIFTIVGVFNAGAGLWILRNPPQTARNLRHAIFQSREA